MRCRAARPQSFAPSNAWRGVGIPGTRSGVHGTTRGSRAVRRRCCRDHQGDRADNAGSVHPRDHSAQSTRPEPRRQPPAACCWSRLAPEPWISSSRPTGRARICSLHFCAARRPRRRRPTLSPVPTTVSWPSPLGWTLCPFTTPCRRSLLEKGRSTTFYARASRTLKLRGGSSSHLRPRRCTFDTSTTSSGSARERR